MNSKNQKNWFWSDEREHIETLTSYLFRIWASGSQQLFSPRWWIGTAAAAELLKCPNWVPPAESVSRELRGGETQYHPLSELSGGIRGKNGKDLHQAGAKSGHSSSSCRHSVSHLLDALFRHLCFRSFLASGRLCRQKTPAVLRRNSLARIFELDYESFCLQLHEQKLQNGFFKNTEMQNTSSEQLQNCCALTRKQFQKLPIFDNYSYPPNYIFTKVPNICNINKMLARTKFFA